MGERYCRQLKYSWNLVTLPKKEQRHQDSDRLRGPHLLPHSWPLSELELEGGTRVLNMFLVLGRGSGCREEQAGWRRQSANGVDGFGDRWEMTTLRANFSPVTWHTLG